MFSALAEQCVFEAFGLLLVDFFNVSLTRNRWSHSDSGFVEFEIILQIITSDLFDQGVLDIHVPLL